MEAKEFWIASCVVMRSLPWTQQSRCILVESMVYPHMHREKPWAAGWGRPNLVCSIEGQMSKAISKHGMTRGTKSQTPKLGFAQDLSEVWWQFEKDSKMMLENECLCTLSEMYSQRHSIHLSNNCSNGGMEVWTSRGRRS
jgi:hypothetical protein